MPRGSAPRVIGSDGRYVRQPIETFLVVSNTRASRSFKKRLIDEGLLEFKCSGEGCGITEWRGKPAPLELDHINGNNCDNRLENLRLLCANCHAQTENYARHKNVKQK